MVNTATSPTCLSDDTSDVESSKQKMENLPLENTSIELYEECRPIPSLKNIKAAQPNVPAESPGSRIDDVPYHP